MNLWVWVLIGLCAAGVIVALIPVFPVFSALKRLRHRVQEMRVSPIFVSLQSLQLKANRLSQVSQRAIPLVDRSNAAVASMKSSIETIGDEDARAAIEETGANLSALIDDLR